jgi:hypothetical protein
MSAPRRPSSGAQTCSIGSVYRFFENRAAIDATLAARSAWRRDRSDRETWAADLERCIERYAPVLPPARRRRAVRAFESIVIALMVSAASSGSGTASQLHEIRSMVVGDTRQLSIEAGNSAS